MIPKIIDICETPSNIALWCSLLSSRSCFLKKPPRGDKRQRSSLSANISKRIRDGVIEKKPKRDRKPEQKSGLDRRLCSICTKIEGKVKAGIRMAVGDDKIADFMVDNYGDLKLKHPQRETCSVPEPTDIDCFSTSEFFVQKALMSFPNGSSAGLDDILPQSLKDLAAKSNGQTGLGFPRALTNFVNVILEGKVPFELRPYFFGVKLIALKCTLEDFVLSLYAILSAGCPQNVPDTMYRIASRGAELASHVLGCLIENP